MEEEYDNICFNAGVIQRKLVQNYHYVEHKTFLV